METVPHLPPPKCSFIPMMPQSGIINAAIYKLKTVIQWKWLPLIFGLRKETDWKVPPLPLQQVPKIGNFQRLLGKGPGEVLWKVERSTPVYVSTIATGIRTEELL